jgi:hypothetical protein
MKDQTYVICPAERLIDQVGLDLRRTFAALHVADRPAESILDDRDINSVGNEYSVKVRLRCVVCGFENKQQRSMREIHFGQFPMDSLTHSQHRVPMRSDILLELRGEVQIDGAPAVLMCMANDFPNALLEREVLPGRKRKRVCSSDSSLLACDHDDLLFMVGLVR